MYIFYIHTKSSPDMWQETQANGHTGQASNDATHQYIALQKTVGEDENMGILKG